MRFQEGSLVQQAQTEIIGTFDRADTVSAAQLRAATSGFSEKTANRARAALTREGVLVRSKRGMEGSITYTIDRQLTPLDTSYGSRRFAKGSELRPRMAGNAVASLRAEQYGEDDYDDDDDDADYENHAASRLWAWIVTITVLICSVGGVVFVRRRFASLPIGNAGAPLVLLPHNAPQLRTPRTVAPYPGDDAIYGPDAPSDETVDTTAGPQADWTFGAFPGMFGSGPQLGA
jgi:hypothetical protein